MNTDLIRQFDSIEFAENPETRCPCVLLLDTSGSMDGEKIAALNHGLRTFQRSLQRDELAAQRVEVGIVTFGPVHVAQEFMSAQQFEAPTLKAQHATPMGQAVEKAVKMIEERKMSYQSNGIGYYRPWVFLITDGEPTDDITTAAHLVQNGEESKAFMFFAVGVDGARMEVLQELSVRQPLKLRELRFEQLFQWLSSSLSATSKSHSGIVPLSNPATPDGWATTE